MDRRMQNSETGDQNAELQSGGRDGQAGRDQNADAAKPSGTLAEAVGRVKAGDVNAYDVVFRACNRRLRTFIAGRYGTCPLFS